MVRVELGGAGWDGTKKGWLYKLGDKFESWKHRFFLLKGGLLLYYAGDSDEHRKNGPKGLVIVDQADVQFIPPMPNKPFCFKISFKDASRTFILCADNEVTRQEWALAIRESTHGARQEQSLKMQRRLNELQSENQSYLETMRVMRENEEKQKKETEKMKEELERVRRAWRVAALKKQSSFTEGITSSPREESETSLVVSENLRQRGASVIQKATRRWMATRRSQLHNPSSPSLTSANTPPPPPPTLYQTALSYLLVLEEIVCFVVDPIELNARSKIPALSLLECSRLFLNLRELWGLQRAFVAVLAMVDEKPQNLTTFAPLIRSMVQMHTVYNDYVRNHQSSLLLLQHLLQNIAFQTLSDRCLARVKRRVGNGGRENLATKLGAPVQYIHKLLGCLMNDVTNLDIAHSARPELLFAVDDLKNIIHNFEETRSKRENSDKLLEIEGSFVSGFPELLDPSRLVVRIGNLKEFRSSPSSSSSGGGGDSTVIVATARYAVLLSDTLVLAQQSGSTLKTPGGGGMVELECCSLSEEAVPEHGEESFMIAVKDRLIILAAFSVEEKKMWLADLTDCIAKLTQRKTESLDYDEEEYKDTEDMKYARKPGATGPPLLVAASVDKAIERLTNASEVDLDFVNCFLLTYRSYMSGEEVLSKIVARYWAQFESSPSTDASHPWHSFALPSSAAPNGENINNNNVGIERVKSDETTKDKNEEINNNGGEGEKDSSDDDDEDSGSSSGDDDDDDDDDENNESNKRNTAILSLGVEMTDDEDEQEAQDIPHHDDDGKIDSNADATRDNSSTKQENRKSRSISMLDSASSRDSAASTASGGGENNMTRQPYRVRRCRSRASVTLSMEEPFREPLRDSHQQTSTSSNNNNNNNNNRPSSLATSENSVSSSSPTHAKSSGLASPRRGGLLGETVVEEEVSGEFHSPPNTENNNSNSQQIEGNGRVSTVSTMFDSGQSFISSPPLSMRTSNVSVGSFMPSSSLMSQSPLFNSSRSSSAAAFSPNSTNSNNNNNNNNNNTTKVRFTPLSLRTFNFLKHWVKEYYSTDFASDDKLSDDLVKFLHVVETFKAHIDWQLARSVQQIFKKHRDAEVRTIKQSGLDFFGNSKLARHFLVQKPPKTLDDFDPKEMAHVMTSVEHAMFSRIPTKEFLGQAWNKKDKADRAPLILSFTKRFNDTSRWVVSEVVSPNNPKKRAVVITKMINIATELMNLSNYNGVMEVLSGLAAAPVHRLKRSWAEVGAKVREQHAELEQLMSPHSSYKNLRQALAATPPPKVPYLGTFLTDLTFVDDGNPDYLPDTHLVNFGKMRIVARIIRTIQQWQTTKYDNLINSADVCAYFCMARLLSDNESYDLSCANEPRESAANSSSSSSSSSSSIPPSARAAPQRFVLAGGVLIKYTKGGKGSKHERTFRVQLPRFLEWKAGKQAYIHELISSPSENVIDRFKLDRAAISRSFRLVLSESATDPKKYECNFTAKTEDEMELWVRGIGYIIEGGYQRDGGGGQQ